MIRKNLNIKNGEKNIMIKQVLIYTTMSGFPTPEDCDEVMKVCNERHCFVQLVWSPCGENNRIMVDESFSNGAYLYACLPRN